MTKTNDKKPTPKRAPYGKERKLSEHEENIVRPLDDHEKSEARVAIVDLMDRKDKIEDEADDEKKRFARLVQGVVADINKQRKLLKEGIEETIVVEVWLTDRGEVIHIDQATGEHLGVSRTATADERQEPLFRDPAPAPATPVQPTLVPLPTSPPASDDFPDFGGPKDQVH
jgi:hypothetical protein